MDFARILSKDYIEVDIYLSTLIAKKYLLTYDALAVVSNNTFYGILTLKDLAIKQKILVIDCVINNQIFPIETAINDIIHYMQTNKTNVIAIGNKNKLAGLLYKRDILMYYKNINESLNATNLENIIKMDALLQIDKSICGLLAHDIKSPLYTAIGYLDLIKNNMKDQNFSAEDKININIVSDHVVKSWNIIDQLVMLLRSKTETNFVVKQKINFCQITQDVINSFKSDAKRKEISVHLITTNNIYIYADIYILTYILKNMLLNAIKYSKRNSDIYICSQDEESETIFIISDRGIGLTPFDHENLFKWLPNKSRPGTENESGNGLGLYISHEIIKKHGGKIWVDKYDNTGCDFKLSIPKEAAIVL